MVSSCNQIKRDSWPMNLCVETAPNVLTSLWEGGPPGSGPWALARGAGERSSSGCRGLIEGCQRPCHTKGCHSPGNFPTALFPQEPVGTSTVPVTCGNIRHGCFRLVVFNLSVPQIHLEGWLKHRFLPPPPCF